MCVNAPLMFKTLDYIREHPEEWNQSQWAASNDKGVRACFAGTALRIAGYDFDFDYYRSPLAFTDHLTDGRIIPEAARQELGLSVHDALILFDENNTYEMLAKYVGEITRAPALTT